MKRIISFVLTIIFTLVFIYLDFPSIEIPEVDFEQGLYNFYGVAPPVKKRIVEVDRDRTRADIVSMAQNYPHTGFDRGRMTEYSISPVLVYPYEAGALKREEYEDALNALKMVRYLAGVPYEDVRFTEELNEISQHGAVLLAASDQFTHYPEKPGDMPDNFFEIALRGTEEANLYAGGTNIAHAVLGFASDEGMNNLTLVGHRRWMLKPGAENYGIGYAKNTESGVSYQGDRISMHIFDGDGAFVCESDSYVAWPAPGDFPIQYFNSSPNLDYPAVSPWSVNLGEPYMAPDRSQVKVTMVRTRDQAVWTFDESLLDKNVESDPDGMVFSVDNDGYGMTKAIVFRPDMESLKIILPEDEFVVRIEGIKDKSGKETRITYGVTFFDLESELGKAQL